MTKRKEPSDDPELVGDLAINQVNLHDAILLKLKSESASERLSGCAILSSLDLSSATIAGLTLTRDLIEALCSLFGRAVKPGDKLEVAAEAAGVIKTWLTIDDDALVHRLYATCIMPSILEGLDGCASLVTSDHVWSRVELPIRDAYIESLLIAIMILVQVIPAALHQVNRSTLANVACIILGGSDLVPVSHEVLIALCQCLATVTEDNKAFVTAQPQAIKTLYGLLDSPDRYAVSLLVPLMLTIRLNLAVELESLDEQLASRNSAIRKLAQLFNEPNLSTELVDALYQALTNLTIDEGTEEDQLTNHYEVALEPVIGLVNHVFYSLSKVASDDKVLDRGLLCLANLILADVDSDYAIEDIWQFCIEHLKTEQNHQLIPSLLAVMRAIALNYAVLELDQDTITRLFKYSERFDIEVITSVLIILSTISSAETQLFTQIVHYVVGLCGSSHDCDIIDACVHSLDRLAQGSPSMFASVIKLAPLLDSCLANISHDSLEAQLIRSLANSDNDDECSNR